MQFAQGNPHNIIARYDPIKQPTQCSLHEAIMASMQATLFFIPCLVVRSHLCDMYEGVGEFIRSHDPHEAIRTMTFYDGHRRHNWHDGHKGYDRHNKKKKATLSRLSQGPWPRAMLDHRFVLLGHVMMLIRWPNDPRLDSQTPPNGTS